MYVRIYEDDVSWMKHCPSELSVKVNYVVIVATTTAADNHEIRPLGWPFRSQH
jgi:hypothetical protein